MKIDMYRKEFKMLHVKKQFSRMIYIRVKRDCSIIIIYKVAL